MQDYNSLKDNPDALITIILDQDKQIALLERYLYNAQKGMFFGSKRETLKSLSDNRQLPIYEGIFDTPTPQKEVPPKKEIKAHTRAQRTKRDLSSLPHVRIEHKPVTTTCLCCNSELARIGEDESTELESQPARLFVNVHVRPRYACSKCKDTVVQALLPESVKPLSKSIVGANLLAQVIVSKFVDHIPLHRQERIFGRQGFAIPRKNLCDWVGLAEDSYLYRLYLALKGELFKESYLQGDETKLKVQDGAVKGSCHNGFLWGAHSPERKIVLFQYDQSRAGSVAEDIYKDFKGTLQADAYAGYNKIILPSEGVTRIACLAHVRRRFVDCEKACSQEASKVLELHQFDVP